MIEKPPCILDNLCESKESVSIMDNTGSVLYYLNCKYGRPHSCTFIDSYMQVFTHSGEVFMSEIDMINDYVNTNNKGNVEVYVESNPDGRPTRYTKIVDGNKLYNTYECNIR